MIAVDSTAAGPFGKPESKATGVVEVRRPRSREFERWLVKAVRLRRSLGDLLASRRCPFDGDPDIDMASARSTPVGRAPNICSIPQLESAGTAPFRAAVARDDSTSIRRMVPTGSACRDRCQ